MNCYLNGSVSFYLMNKNFCLHHQELGFDSCISFDEQLLSSFIDAFSNFSHEISEGQLDYINSHWAQDKAIKFFINYGNDCYCLIALKGKTDLIISQTMNDLNQRVLKVIETDYKDNLDSFTKKGTHQFPGLESFIKSRVPLICEQTRNKYLRLIISEAKPKWLSDFDLMTGRTRNLHSLNDDYWMRIIKESHKLFSKGLRKTIQEVNEEYWNAWRLFNV